ncbi:MAG: hypothetical protein JSU87_08225 [Gemmatimonadota bacterium]|nr:MAG: hypothetical protein JSU87_08225 [Gemmatimonadota bacterium]
MASSTSAFIKTIESVGEQVASARLVALGPEVARQLVAADTLLIGDAQQRQQGEAAALGHTSRHRSEWTFKGETAQQSKRVHRSAVLRIS